VDIADDLAVGNCQKVCARQRLESTQTIVVFIRATSTAHETAVHACYHDLKQQIDHPTMTTLQQLRQQCARPSKSNCFTCVRPTATAVKRSQQQQHGSNTPAEVSRRGLLAGLSAAGLISSSFLQPQAAAANPLEDIARQLTRPDITPLDAAVALLDARATLKEMAPLVGLQDA
jgi:hypothetical protein